MSFGNEDEKLKVLAKAIPVLLKLVSDYGEVLERHASTKKYLIKIPETELPTDKKGMETAIGTILMVINESKFRLFVEQVLPPPIVQAIMSPDFKKQLEIGLVMLNNFVPAEEADAERKELEEAVRLARKIEPKLGEKFEKVLKLDSKENDEG